MLRGWILPNITLLVVLADGFYRHGSSGVEVTHILLRMELEPDMMKNPPENSSSIRELELQRRKQQWLSSGFMSIRVEATGLLVACHSRCRYWFGLSISSD